MQNMLVNKSYYYRIYPNKEQEILIQKTFGSCRFVYNYYLAKRIEMIGKFAKHIHVYNKDAVDLLKEVDKLLPKNSLIYLDPPYYVKGQGLYRNFYKHDDHVAIRNVLDSVQANWIVSYDNCPEIKEIYYGYTQDDYILNYSAYHKMKGSEVMIYGPSIKSIGTPNAQLTLGIA